MPAVSRELCGSHAFGGDSFPVGGDMGFAGQAEALSFGHRHMYASGVFVGDGETKLPGILILPCAGVLEGHGTSKCSFSRALYAAAPYTGESVSRAVNNVGYVFPLDLEGNSASLSSLYRSIHSMAGIVGKVDLQAGANFHFRFNTPLEGEGESISRGIEELRLHGVLEGESEKQTAMQVQFSLHATPEGTSKMQIWPLCYVEGLGLPVSVQTPEIIKGVIPIVSGARQLLVTVRNER